MPGEPVTMTAQRGTNYCWLTLTALLRPLDLGILARMIFCGCDPLHTNCGEREKTCLDSFSPRTARCGEPMWSTGCSVGVRLEAHDRHGAVRFGAAEHAPPFGEQPHRPKKTNGSRHLSSNHIDSRRTSLTFRIDHRNNRGGRIDLPRREHWPSEPREVSSVLSRSARYRRG